MDEQIERGAYHLLSVWLQYGNGSHATPGRISHANMCAGEDAVEWLEGLGLVEDEGYEARITDAGLALIAKYDE